MTADGYIYPRRHFLGGYINYDYPGEREWILTVIAEMNRWAINSRLEMEADGRP